MSSPLVKILESRIKKKLERYMNNELICSQTGFVPGNGILVNQTRLIDRVLKRVAHHEPKQRKHVYGLFIDFSNSYNTVPHQRLFKKLEKALNDKEIQMVKAIYSRNKIKLGAQCFTPNVGVAQGSIISPALFNVYCQDLYERIRDEADVNEEDLLGYADDLLVICTSLSQLRRVIQIINCWSEENNLQLNSKKSGIVEFLSRVGNIRKILKVGESFEGIPVVSEYKYLGMWLDSKLTMDPQLKHILRRNQLSFSINCSLYSEIFLLIIGLICG